MKKNVLLIFLIIYSSYVIAQVNPRNIISSTYVQLNDNTFRVYLDVQLSRNQYFAADNSDYNIKTFLLETSIASNLEAIGNYKIIGKQVEAFNSNFKRKIKVYYKKVTIYQDFKLKNNPKTNKVGLVELRCQYIGGNEKISGVYELCMVYSLEKYLVQKKIPTITVGKRRKSRWGKKCSKNK